MADSIDSKLDALFQLPPGELVAARNALADALKRAGDKAGAAQVKAIKRAAPVAWALNQVHFSEPELLARAREVSDELRGLQAQRGVDPRELAETVERQRTSMDAVVSAALAAWRQAGLSDAGPAQRKLFTTLQAWLAGKGDEPAGRMTQELEPIGFEAFAGMTISAAPTAVPAARSATSPTRAPVQAVQTPAVVQREPDPAELKRAALERARKLVAELEQAAAAVRDRVGLRTGEQAAARRTRDEAEASVRDAERRLGELSALLVQREQALQRSSALLAEAQREQTRADEAVASARAELANASSGGKT